MEYPAHFRIGPGGNIEFQTVPEHSRNTAKIAGSRLRPVRLESVGYLAGLTHDFAKLTPTYRAYLERAAAGEPVRRGSVIHAHGGARFLLERYHTPGAFTSFEDMTAEILAFAVGAHHGLFDCVGAQHQIGFIRRLEWDDELYQEAYQEFLDQCAGFVELDQLFQQANQELSPIFQWANAEIKEDGRDVFFYLGLLARLVLSAVIEGDRQDTAQWMANGALPAPPPTPDWSQLLNLMESKLTSLPRDAPIQQARRAISQQCREAAGQGGGIYRLNVPTGGGKTLASLRYALAHAAQHGKSRLIFTSPLLSILEQNAAVLRQYIGDDTLILEHHSNIVQTGSDGTSLDPRELMAENWGAPAIITTLVQLLDTLFDGRTTCIRRFQSLCNSVLVIDEVQTVPPRMLTLFHLAIHFLAHVCGTTVILCSATQPSLAVAHHPIPGPVAELVPYDPAIWAPFRRTRLTDAGPRRLDEIPALLLEHLERVNSLLVVCNMKGQARSLYHKTTGPELRRFHLSAAMCPEHRRATLAELDEALKASRTGGPKVLCVATQVVEAGVDLSFGSAVRLIAGMDNAVQTAGRCNRSGESKTPVPVLLINCIDENLGKLRDIQDAKTASLQLLSEFRQDPAALGGDLTSDAAIARYYSCLYGGMGEGAQDYPLREGGTLFDLLSTNDTYAAGQPGMERFGLHQAFSLAGHAFQVFDQETIDVLAPYGKGRELIAALSCAKAQHNWRLQRELLRQARPFTISLYRFQREALESRGALSPLLDGAVLALHPEYYHQETGLVLEPETTDQFLEV